MVDSKLKEIRNDLGPRPNRGLTRSAEVKLTRLRIGHTALTQRYLLERGTVPLCRWCDRELTVKHILLECAGLEPMRLGHYSCRDMKALFESVDPQKILDFLRECRLSGSL